MGNKKAKGRPKLQKGGVGRVNVSMTRDTKAKLKKIDEKLSVAIRKAAEQYKD